MNPTETILLEETDKWLKKLEAKPLVAKEESREQVTNIKAYISDCKHFLSKNDYVRAFEAIIYAWGIYDSLRNLHLIKADANTNFT